MKNQKTQEQQGHVTIGDVILGSIVIQDPKEMWMKVDGITMGDSPLFGYKIIKNNDIGDLLTSLENDDDAMVVNYNWSDGKAYVKKKYDIHSTNDCFINKGFTTFIKK